MRHNLPIPQSFTNKKNAILVALAIPDSTYTDLSPKGSVDIAIKPLIDRINALEGVVTTSSCAGRLSVFLEGRKQGTGNGEGGGVKKIEGLGKESEQTAVPGGKGMGGRWLFVSHEPIKLFPGNSAELLGLGPAGQHLGALNLTADVKDMQLVRFQFEPLILHIMTASLHHAQPILAAAINAGFRESGIQSLKNLDDPNAFPMVAIRTAGLAFESLIGVKPNPVQDEDGEDGLAEHITSLVNDGYLELLIGIANERFKANAERIQRFEEGLFQREVRPEREREDGKTRQERKRAEGLKQQEALRRRKEGVETNDNLKADVDNDEGNSTFFGSLPHDHDS